MSEDVEKPLTGADAEAQPTKPGTDGRTADSITGADASAADAVQEDVGGVQGASAAEAEDKAPQPESPLISGPATAPDVGGGEIEWTLLGKEPPIDGDEA